MSRLPRPTWATYQVTHGMPGPVFLVIIPRTSLGELDPGLGEQAVGKAMTPSRVGVFNQLATDAFLSIENKLFRLRPGMSNPSPEFSAGDPDFWRMPPD